jgi:hypothetical protein
MEVALNWNSVGSVPSTLKVSTDGGTLPPENVVCPALSDSAPLNAGFADRVASGSVYPAPDAAC